MSRVIKIAHLTSVHPRYDTRIFLKQCRSLARAGHDITLIVADGKGDESRDQISIKDVGPATGRMDRVRNVTRRVYRLAQLVNADVYHIHDPELLPAALKLKRAGKLVIFDSHEDVPKQLLGKSYLNPAVRLTLSRAFKLYEEYVCRRLDAVVAATPFIRDKFLSINKTSIDVNNYPMIEEFDLNESNDLSQKENQVCYIGGIASIRGIHEMIQAIALARTDTRLQLGGIFFEPSLKDKVMKDAGWSKVDDLGWLDRPQVAAVLQRSVAGLVTLRPAINYLDSLPVKMFEYMSAGIPVIASNFPLWRKIIESNDCGLCVDPLDPEAIAGSIDFLIGNPERARQMGLNGRNAVMDRYNWAIEEQKLLALYSTLWNKKH